MVKIVSPLSQREVEAATVDFEGKSEPRSTYELDDGTTLKIRVTVNAIARLEGEFDAHGMPVYTVQSGTVVRVVKSKDSWPADDPWSGDYETREEGARGWVRHCNPQPRREGASNSEVESHRRVSNPRPAVYETAALPLSYGGDGRSEAGAPR